MDNSEIRNGQKLPRVPRATRRVYDDRFSTWHAEDVDTGILWGSLLHNRLVVLNLCVLQAWPYLRGVQRAWTPRDFFNILFLTKYQNLNSIKLQYYKKNSGYGLGCRWPKTFTKFFLWPFWKYCSRASMRAICNKVSFVSTRVKSKNM